MAEQPEAGTLRSSSFEEMLTLLTDEVAVELPFPTTGRVVRLRRSPLAPEYFDIAVFCVGDEDHEGHLIDGRELQTQDELEGILRAVKTDEELNQMLKALMS